MKKLLIRSFSFAAGNQDLLAIALICLIFSTFGFVLACLYLGIAYDMIEISLKMIVAFFISLFSGLGSILFFTTRKQGMIVKSIQNTIQTRMQQIEQSQKEPDKAKISPLGISLDGIEKPKNV